ncbi:16160_t:CDS:2, partial [Acaulospora colombiana]
GIVSPANPTFNVVEASFQLSDSGASFIVAHPLTLPIVVKAAAEAQIPYSKIFVFGDEEIDGVQPYRTLFVDREFEPMEYTPEESRNTTAFLCYSSGTTGKNKGVETTHTNMLSIPSIIIFPIGKNLILDYHLSTAVLPHLWVNHAPPFRSNFVIIPKFDLATFCRIVQDYKVDYAHLVPPIILLLVKSPIVNEYDLSSLRTVTSGAASLSKSLMDDLYNTHKISIKEGYGSVGILLSNVEAKVISEDGQGNKYILLYDMVSYTVNGFNYNDILLDSELGHNKPGELCVRGPNVMKGYLNNKDATDSVMDKDGFFHTGDIAIMDEQENLYIVDRVKELIKYKCFQVAPAELEEILVSYPAVLDTAVVGVYCEEDATEYVLAYVVLQTGYEQSPELITKIKEYVSDRVAPHKKLKDVIFIDQIPKSASGKILRRILREKAKVEYVFPLQE